MTVIGNPGTLARAINDAGQVAGEADASGSDTYGSIAGLMGWE
jgi:hypothetical protein